MASGFACTLDVMLVCAQRLNVVSLDRVFVSLAADAGTTRLRLDKRVRDAIFRVFFMSEAISTGWHTNNFRRRKFLCLIGQPFSDLS